MQSVTNIFEELSDLLAGFAALALVDAEMTGVFGTAQNTAVLTDCTGRIHSILRQLPGHNILDAAQRTKRRGLVN